MSQPAAETMLRELDRFVGEWTMTAAPPGGASWPGEARVRFEWLDGAFLLQRWTLRGGPEGAPTGGTAIIGGDAAGGTYVQLYRDDRGVSRAYEVGVRGREWMLRRDGPPFAQLSRGTFSADGRTIRGRWELKEDGGDWRTDFDVTYTRAP